MMSDLTAVTRAAHDERGWYLTIWLMLVMLLAAGLAIFALPISRQVAVAIIFAIAAVKAALVLRNYMHLKHEHLLIYAIVLLPFLFALGLALTLIPDLVF